jgi:hypothetical protein
MIFRNRVCWLLWILPYLFLLVITGLPTSVVGYCVGYAVRLSSHIVFCFQHGYDAANTEAEYVPASNTVRGLP